jgi:hypothetical protein
VAAHRGMHVEQRAVGVEDIGGMAHRTLSCTTASANGGLASSDAGVAPGISDSRALTG